MAKESLPPINVNASTHPNLVELARQAQALSAQVDDLTTREKTARKTLADAAEQLRMAEQARGNYIGAVNITDPAVSTTQVLFKILSGSQDVDIKDDHDNVVGNRMDLLDQLYGSSREIFYEKDVEIKKITNPQDLIERLVSQGKDPWQSLELKVKDHRTVSNVGANSVIRDEAIVPKEGFLRHTNENLNTLSKEAIEYHNAYLASALSPTVDLGKKGRKS